ncbi:MipA/OmpV family protein [Ottowia thiooxydans]|uniref:MipA/OmpV family protein n=1 Tax=Ottowia thiooxydans TaxID=219182 RepID=UPI0004202D99|nr:MipA/OmpV family protein [Ottowia thiooxydans]
MPSSSVVASLYKANAANLTRTSALSALLACLAPAFAQQPPGKGELESSPWGLGMAVISTQKAYKGISRESKVLPMISYENRYVKLLGPNLELKLPGIELSGSQRLNFGVVTKLFDGAGYEASDSSALTGMADRKSGAWLGAKVEWENDLADVKLEWLGDASGKSKGQRLALSFERKIMLSPQLMLIPKVGAEWVDRKYVDYYYGVRASEATVGRAAYTGKATVNPEVSLTGIYRFDRHHSLMLNVGVTSLGKGVKNSPIVDRSTESRVMLGYKYSF